MTACPACTAAALVGIARPCRRHRAPHARAVRVCDECGAEPHHAKGLGPRCYGRAYMRRRRSAGKE